MLLLDRAGVTWYFDPRRISTLVQEDTFTLELGLMQEFNSVAWAVGSNLLGGPIRFFSSQQVPYDWNNKDSGVYYPFHGKGHLKDSLLGLYL